MLKFVQVDTVSLGAEGSKWRETPLKSSMQRAVWVLWTNNLCIWNEKRAGGRDEEKKEEEEGGL